MASTAHQRALSPTEPAPYHPLVVVLAALAAGILVDRLTGFGALWWWLISLAGIAAWYGVWHRQYNRAAACVLLVVVAAAGAAWHNVCWRCFATDEIARFAGEHSQPSAIEAVAATAARRIPAPAYNPMRIVPVGDRTRLTVRVTAIRDGDAWRAVSGNATLLVDGHLLDVQPGDRLRVFGQLAALRTAQNPGEFDSANYGRGNRQLCIVRCDSPDCVTRLAAGGWSVTRLLGQVRNQGNELVWRHLDRDRSALASAVLLGFREQLDQDHNTAFMATGTIHVLSISGLHVGILAWLLFRGLRLGLVPRGPALVAVATLVTTYTLLTDAEPPAVRATVMVLVMCLAVYFGRQALSFNVLAAAAILVLAINPVELFRTGAQLSFLCMGCLAWFAPRWREWRQPDALDLLIARSRPLSWRVGAQFGHVAARALAVSLLIWLVTMPIVATQFHLASPVALALNPLLATPIAIAMASGFAMLIGGALVPALGAMFGWLCDRMLWILDSTVVTSADLRLGHVWTPGPQAWWLVGFYAGLALWLTLGARRPSRRWCAALAIGWVGLGFAVPLVARSNVGRLECGFVSVGHGNSQIVRLPDGKTLLYDAGGMGSPDFASRLIAGCLWSRGITHLDAVVISHADADHYNGLPGLLERFSVGAVYVSPVMFRDQTAGLAALKSAIAAADVPLRLMAARDQMLVGPDCTVTALYPVRDHAATADNANSIVLSIEYCGRRILLTGDLEPPGLTELVEQSPLHCDVLLAPHHGSVGSTPHQLAAWSTPDWVVVSGAHADDVEAAERIYSAAGARVLHTAATGFVSVEIDGPSLRVNRWRPATVTLH